MPSTRLIGRRVERSRLGEMQIDIWSDVVCPWCYLGKRRFEKALAGFGGRDDVRVSHRSFQLDPTRARGETSRRRAMLQSKYRLSEDQVRAMDHKMEQMAAAEGLEYHLTDAGLTGNTLDAHQLVHLAARHGLEDKMLERLYKAYFSEERSVFDLDSLVRVWPWKRASTPQRCARPWTGGRLRRRGRARPERGAVTRRDRRPVLRHRRPLRHLGRAGDRRFQSRADDGRCSRFYSVLTRTFRNFTVPAPYWSAIGALRVLGIVYVDHLHTVDSDGQLRATCRDVDGVPFATGHDHAGWLGHVDDPAGAVASGPGACRRCSPRRRSSR